MSMKPQIIEKEGKKEFVVISYDEFLSMQERLEDYDDLKDLREVKSVAEQDAGIPLSALRDELLNS